MIKLNSRRNRQQGFTLIEVMVAFAVLAFGLLAIGSFQAKLVSGSGYSKARAEAVAIAQQKLDEIRSYVNQPQLVANL
jgi:prepilin-type N-terminal cleavage/methylation domain-containing protein